MLFLLLLSLPFPFRRRFSLQFPFAVFDFAGDRPMIKWLFSLKHVCPHYLPPPPTLFNNKKTKRTLQRKKSLLAGQVLSICSRVQSSIKFRSDSRKITVCMVCLWPIRIFSFPTGFGGARAQTHDPRIAWPLGVFPLH